MVPRVALKCGPWYPFWRVMTSFWSKKTSRSLHMQGSDTYHSSIVRRRPRSTVSSRCQITIVITFLPGKILLPQRFRRVNILPRGKLLVITPKGILFISQTDLVKYLQIPVNASNLENSPLLTPKGHTRVCWVIWINIKLQRTAIENARIDTIDTTDTINRIDCINQYEDNWYNLSYRLTLHTSPTQLHQCCFLFRFYLLVKVRRIVVLHSVSYCWYAHLCFIFCLYLPLNTTVVPTSEVRLISQRGMDYFVYITVICFFLDLSY